MKYSAPCSERSVRQTSHRQSGPPRGSLAWQDNRLGRRGPDPPSGERRSEHSPDTGLVQAFIQPAMFVFPITRPDLNRLAGVEPFKGQSFKLVLCLLLSADQALNVGFDSKSLGFRSGAESFFEVGMDCDRHGSSA